MRINVREMYRNADERRVEKVTARLTAPPPLPEPPTVRIPLTANQHILHLLLTLVTGGLWGIVWFIRASWGNRVPADGEHPH